MRSGTQAPDSQSGSSSIGGIALVFDSLSSGIQRRMPNSSGILVYRGGRISLSFTELCFPTQMGGVRRGNSGVLQDFLCVEPARLLGLPAPC